MAVEPGSGVSNRIRVRGFRVLRLSRGPVYIVMSSIHSDYCRTHF